MRYIRDNFRPEAVGDVMSGVAVQQFGVDVTVKFGDSRSNGSRYIRGLILCRTNERTLPKLVWLNWSR